MTIIEWNEYSTLDHAPIPVIAWGDATFPGPPPGPVDSDEFIGAAGHAARMLPIEVHDALVDFADRANPVGAVAFSGLPIGDIPATPRRPTAQTAKSAHSEFLLLAAARRLGQPVGYLPEHGGSIVQNLVPTPGGAERQVSTSSRTTLMFHTEAAFHPHRPRYLLLLCLRGDAEGRAATTLASIREVAPLLDATDRDTLFEARFETQPDESYLGGARGGFGPAVPVLSGDRHDPTMVFDADLMRGQDARAQRALDALAEAVASHHTGHVLSAGDLLVVDNDRAVHGRSPFQARFDGTDRWLQRSMVVADLGPSAADRIGRVIATRFDN